LILFNLLILNIDEAGFKKKHRLKMKNEPKVLKTLAVVFITFDKKPKH